MSKYFIVIIFILLTAGGLWYYFFNKPIRPQEPVRSTLDSTLSLPVSTIRIPIEFQLKDLEKMVNTRLKGIFVQEWLPLGEKKKDSVYLELERTNPIRFAWEPGTISAKVPLRISFRFKKRAAGIRIQNERPIVAEVILHLKSRIHLDDQWGIHSTTSLDTIVWEMEPSVKIVFVNVNLRKFADNYLEKNQTRITQRFDSIAHALLDTRKIADKIWKDIQKPIVIKKTMPQIGLSAHAEELMSRWNSNPEGNISGMITLRAKVYAWFDEPQEHKIPPLPKHKYASQADESLDLFVMAKLPYDKLNSFTNKNIEKISYTYESYTIGIRDAEFYGSGQELALMMRVKGALRGKVYLRALPYFDTLKQVVGLRNLRYDLHTEEALLNTADWMLHDKLIYMLADTVKKDISEELSRLPQLIEQGVAKGKTGEKMALTVDSLAVTSHASLITRHDVQWIFRARGKAGIALDKKILERKKSKK
jgi:Domain of unknown function (DUF4403)